jgi:peptidyl-dipeptidase Dcp
MRNRPPSPIVTVGGFHGTWDTAPRGASDAGSGARVRHPLQAFLPTKPVSDLNPLLAPSPLPFGAPDFAAVREEHFLPAFAEGMRLHREDVAAIGADPAPPTFANTVAALERSGRTMDRVQRTFVALASAHTTPGLQEIETAMAPRLAAHGDDILLDPALFRRLETLGERVAEGELELDEEEARLLEHHHATFVRAGARLDATGQARIRVINEELSTLSTRFRQSLLEMTREGAVVAEDAALLDGMSPAEIRGAREDAQAHGLDRGWRIPLTNTTRHPRLASLRDRSFRRRLWTASARRGQGGDPAIGACVDTRPLVRRIAELRVERARLLGHASWAAYILEREMAASPEAALAMLTELVPAVRARTEAEGREIEKEMRRDAVEGPVEPWDWEYYAERVRQERFAVDDRELRPFLELEQVLRDGVFFTMNRLFGISFRRRNDLPVYHPDVRVYDVVEEDGRPLGLFYLDPFARDSKRGGAWMSTFVIQARLLGQAPVIVNVLNIPKPADGEPALLTLDEVTTLFHEMGHALHGLFSDVVHPTMAGTSVARDFVEFPSTFQEDWATDPEVLASYARHHDTGDPIPADLLDRIRAARTFNQGFDTLEYLAAALLDLAWHTLEPDGIPDDVMAFEAGSLARFGVDLPAVPPRYRSPYFSHIFAGGYSSRYYAYLWSEVLAADAFAFVRDRGGLTRENGERLRREVLSRGNSRDTMGTYRSFRGRDPEVEALLVRRGLRDGGRAPGDEALARSPEP